MTFKWERKEKKFSKLIKFSRLLSFWLYAMSVDDPSYECFLKNGINIPSEVAVIPSAEINSQETPNQVKTRKELSLKEKLEVLKQYDKLPKMSQRSAAVQLNISQPVLCKILKNRYFIENIMRTNKNSVRKRKRGGKEREIESALKLWYVEVQKRNIPINRHIIREKAKELAKQMGKEFAATDGWFTRWRKRENIVCSLLRNKFQPKKDCDSLGKDSKYHRQLVDIRVREDLETYGTAESKFTDSSVKQNLSNETSKLQYPLKVNTGTKVPAVGESEGWEMQNENICEVFIKTEPAYEDYESEKNSNEKPPTDEEMLEALRVLRTGVKLRTNDLQLHYEYEHFIYELLKKVF